MIIIWCVISVLITTILFISGAISTVSSGLISFVVFFFAQLFVWAVIGVIATFFVDIHKENEKDSKFFRFYAYCIVDILQCVLRYRVKITGFEKIPDSKFLLISNHRSAFDAIIQFGAFRKYNLSFVSKKENISMPIFGKIMHRCSVVSLDRENPRQAIMAISQTAAIIKSGTGAMGIYPEGTRNHGDGLLPFKPGALKIAKKAACPIVIAVIQHSELIKKNTPFKKTVITLEVLDVLSADFVKEHNTTQLCEVAGDLMLEALTSKKNG